MQRNSLFIQKNKLKDYLPSRLHLYYFARLIENKLGKNIEVKFPNIFKAIEQYGICTEKEYPYDVNKVNNLPEIQTEKINIIHGVLHEDIYCIKKQLSKGVPVLFTFDIFSNFLTDTVKQTGYVKMPLHKERPIGKISSAIYGYRNSSNCFICMNNNGVEWGEKGFFYLPYEYVSKYAYNFYSIDLTL